MTTVAASPYSETSSDVSTSIARKSQSLNRLDQALHLGVASQPPSAAVTSGAATMAKKSFSTAEAAGEELEETIHHVEVSKSGAPLEHFDQSHWTADTQERWVKHRGYCNSNMTSFKSWLLLKIRFLSWKVAAADFG